MSSLLANCAILLSLQIAYAGSATWDLNPTSNDWRTAANWTPDTVPNGPSDVATFATSSMTGISLGAFDEVSSIVFPPGASSFTITEMVGTLTISGAGVVNNSGVPQNFVAQSQQQLGNDAVISFIGQASAGDARYSNYGEAFEAVPKGKTEFHNNATAANATFFNHTGGFGDGGHTDFFDASTAANATFFNDAASAAIGFAYGYTQFYGTSSADHATFTCYGGADPGFSGGTASFSDDATAAESTFLIEGGTAAQAGGGQLSFSASATAANSTLTIKAGSNGGLDAYLYFLQDSLGGQARIILSGTLDMSGHDSPGVSTGSIEGSGTIILGPNNLTIGSNNLSTTFSGVISGDGSLTKIGQGRLTLTHENTYTGGTHIRRGELFLNNKTNLSTTGTGNVVVNGGKLGGNGVIGGAVVVGNNSGQPAILEPQAGHGGVYLTIEKNLTFNSDATCLIAINSNKGSYGIVTANRVTINADALFAITDAGNSSLGGVHLVMINNVGSAPIAGIFSNLPDGGTIVVGQNTFQANYHGGDGNDLELTTIP